MKPIEITPISSLLSTELENPTIRARVTWKSEITPWQSFIREGIIFHMHLLDESGQVTGVLFDCECEKFYHQIQVGNVYVFSNFVQEDEVRFRVLDHTRQIGFGFNTVVQPNVDVPEISKIKYEFVPLSKISTKPDGDPVDAIGICTEVRGVENRGGNIIRELLLVDADYQKIMLNLWEKTAEKFEGAVGDVIVVKGARVQEHNNEKKMNASWYTMVQINPEIPEAIQMREWYGIKQEIF
ncbi:replication protein A 70 kDa DNA-binding subunit-like [Drosophila elegans]|uniref:replication protein A 70 kDa DNA-binding subunit-like n=1 Tax=Drosophila elegans TaxID=30023 RepID=UPI0007E5DC9A|nr:replication protein A 70 kDa DNA-binding subunit-like [Drosophila elegans]